MRSAHRLGIPIVAGSDGADFGRELELLVEEGGLTPLEALASATSVAARAIGVEDEIGRVAPGFKADLVVLDADPSERVQTLRRIAMVIKNGKIVFNP